MLTIAARLRQRTLVPRTRSSHNNRCESGCELRVQSGTRIIDLTSALRFRSSHQSVRQGRANFGIGALALPRFCHAKRREVLRVEQRTSGTMPRLYPFLLAVGLLFTAIAQ